MEETMETCVQTERRIALRQAYEQFRLRCESRNLSPGTLLWYRQILGGMERFLSTCFEVLYLDEVNAGHLRAYLCDLKGRGICSETVHRTYGGLRCFFKFLLREGTLRRNPMELVEKPRRERHLIQPLKAEQVLALLDQLDTKCVFRRSRGLSRPEGEGLFGLCRGPLGA